MAAPAQKVLKEYTEAEVARHDGGITIKALTKKLESASADEKAKIEAEIKQYHNDTWIILHGVIFDVTKFKSKHPGGPQSFVETAGKDATKEFEELYHSATARDMLRDMTVGKLAGYEGDLERVYQFSSTDVASQNLGVVIAVGVAVAAGLYYAFF